MKYGVEFHTGITRQLKDCFHTFIPMYKNLISTVIVTFFIEALILGQTANYTVKKAPFSSDKYDEFSPVYYKNGIVFCSNHNTDLLFNYSTSHNKGFLKINYADTSANATWRNVRLLSKTLSSHYNDGPVTFNHTGDTIYFARNLVVDGSPRDVLSARNKLGVFYAVLVDGKWTKITEFRYNSDSYNVTTPCLSPDGKRLFFASDKPDGYGGSDLYYCQWKDSYWNSPVNLGPLINTSGNEAYPFVNRAGGLFFSSDGLPGLGGKDIFYTKQEGTEWLTPVPLDAPVNSRYDDFGFIADSVMNEGYFSSKRDSSIDIYHYKTNIHQLFYCQIQRTNQYCFKFIDEGNIKIDDSYLQYIWNFGDGSKATGQNVEHCFPGPGKYSVKLDVVEKKSGRLFFSKLSYNLELKEIEQPVINSLPSAIAGDLVSFDGLSTNFPGSRILTYTWYFGDGDRKTGERVSHSFKNTGEYEVKLGVILRQDKTGIIHEECASRLIKVFIDKQEKSTFDSKVNKPAPRINILNYNNAFIENMYSAEKEFNQDLVFHVEILTSKTRLSLDDNVFNKVPEKYSVKEIRVGTENIFSYIIDEEMNLVSTYPAYNEIITLGFKNTRIRTFTLVDPAAKELNTLKKIFGVSVDTFFKQNDYNLSSAGTQMLDLVIGFMSKYSGIKLEISTHTDNAGSPAANLLLSQKRADSMTNYLIINGVSSTRLIPKGLGGSKPIASNFLEAERKLNRRIEFTIIRK